MTRPRSPSRPPAGPPRSGDLCVCPRYAIGRRLSDFDGKRPPSTIVELIDAFRAGTWQRGVLLGLAGVVTLAAGVLFIARPVVGLVALTVVFIAYLIFVGAFRIVMAFELPRGSPGKFWAFVSGVVTLVLAYLAIAQMPNISVWLIGTFIGVSLIFAGVARISLARGFRKATDLLSTPPPAQRGAHA
jgi:hypothetical protein